VHRPFRFAPPTPGPAAVLRPRLLTGVGRRFDLRLVTVEAGAGLGKTTLLAQAVGENRLIGRGRDCWLTCEPADASASTLLGALLEAIGAPEAIEQPSVEHVCEAVWASTPTQVCLVLDDIHHIEPGSPGEGVVQRLLDQLPENGHLVLAGRGLPALARSRLLVHDRAVEITADDLRLDDAETTMFAETHGVAVDLVHQAHGWPALAELYARTGQAYAERFVFEEVLSILPDRERQAFLLLVAVGGADADVLEAVTDGPCDVELLSQLPLVSSDDKGGLRPHALWGALVQARVDPAAASAARRRLADAVLGRGDHGLAFELLAATGDWDHALPVLFDACNDQRHPPWHDQMERWRRLIPDHLSRAPEVLYAEAMIERVGDSWSPAADALFAEAIRSFQQRGDVAREITARVRSVYAGWVRADRALFDDEYARAIELVAAGVPLQPIVAFNRAIVADIEGRAADVRMLEAQIGPLEPRLRHFHGLLGVFAALAEGAPETAVADADDAAMAAAAVAPAAGTGWAWLAPSLVAWTRGDLARVLARPATDPGPRYPLAERVPALALGAVVSAHLGDVDRAGGLMHDIDALVPDLGPRDLLAGFRAVAAAAVAVAAADEDGARVALADGLAGRALLAGGAGRALRWFPSLPYLFHDEARAHLALLPSGESRRRTLAICQALLDARAGPAKVPTTMFEDAAVLLTALPAPLAIELVVRAGRDGPSAIHVGCTAALADLAPVGVREALRRLADTPEPAVSRAAHALLATVPIPPTHLVRIEVLGPGRLLRDGVVVDSPDWRRQRVRQLVCALVALREVRRSRLGVLLWPEFDEKSVSSNLRMTLTYVQALLEPERGRGDAPWFLQQSMGVLRLRADTHLSVDAWEFDAALDAADTAAAASTPSVELQHLLAATALWQGDYLDDVAGEDWAEPLRARARQRFVRGAVRAGDLLLASSRFDEAVDLAERALEADPWCEPALRLRVSAHLAAGDRSAALSAFEAGRRVLIDLGVALEPATEALGERLAR
jgi:DNA-binding SARP family transcriptional activator